MKSIMLSIQPKWVEKILNGGKTIEVRKTAPKDELSIDVYIYCTKGATLYRSNYNKAIILTKPKLKELLEDNGHTIFNGKVVAKFTLNKVEEICPSAIKNPELYYKNLDGKDWENAEQLRDELRIIPKKACLTIEEIEKYVSGKEILAWNEKTQRYTEPSGVMVYPRNPKFWHISDLQIFDKPRGLWEFFKPCGNCDKKGTMRCTEEISPCNATVITTAPQSWCYVEAAK